MLRKKPVVTCRPDPPTSSILRRRPIATGGLESARFPVGLCYLVGVTPSKRGAAITELGSYPTVDLLLASWIFDQSVVFLTAQRDGLYHATRSPAANSIPFTLGHGHWQVGADTGFLILPP